ncbi:MAG: hypothetical protein V3U72_04645 [Candidatus Aenigmarchaeota archaeon]
MNILGEIFRSIVGRVHFRIYLGKTPAAEIEIKDKDIIVNIIHPLIALELGIEELLSRKGKKDIDMIEKLEKAGYNIKIRYKMFELDL